MTDYAEYVSPGHPDRLADAIAEGLVTAAVRNRPDALVGVEVAVHRHHVFVDGRIAAGATRVDVAGVVRDVYRNAGYGGAWGPDPATLTLTTDLCEEELPAAESDIRPFSDDQNIVIGYACGDATTNFLPPAHWVAGELGRRLAATLRTDPGLAETYGPDFKILVVLDHDARTRRIQWRRLVLSVLHRPGLTSETQHRQLVPLVAGILRDLEVSGLAGIATTFSTAVLTLNGAGDFVLGGPHGDNGLSGKKLVVDHYGPSVPIGGGALAGKDPHKVDKCGALRARQLAKRLVREGAEEARVILAWAPGAEATFSPEIVTTTGGVRIRLPAEEIPALDWFAIRRIVHDLELVQRDWRADLLAGYLCHPDSPWER